MLSIWAAQWRGESKSIRKFLACFVAYILTNLLVAGILLPQIFSSSKLDQASSAWREIVLFLWLGLPFGAGLLAFYLLFVRLHGKTKSLWRAAPAIGNATQAFRSGLVMLCLLIVFDLASGRGSELASRVDTYPWQVWLGLVVFGILCIAIQATSEEIFFRGYMQALASNWLGGVRGFALTAIVFTLPHFSQGLWGGFAVLGIGLALGYSAVRCGSIFPATGMHIVVNCYFFMLHPNQPAASDASSLIKALAMSAIWLLWIEYEARLQRKMLPK